MSWGKGEVLHLILNCVIGSVIVVLFGHWAWLRVIPLGPRLRARMDREREKRGVCMRKKDMVCTDFHERRLQVLQDIYDLNKQHF
jgi:hypothetical protein